MDVQDLKKGLQDIAEAVDLPQSALIILLQSHPFADPDEQDPNQTRLKVFSDQLIDPVSDDQKVVRQALDEAIAYAQNVYFETIVANKDKYIPRIKALLDEIKPLLQEGESVEDYLQRIGKNSYVQFVFMPTPTPTSIGGRRAKNVTYPVDKPNRHIWDLLEENTHGQLELPINVAPRGSKPPIDVMYSINFDDIESDVPIVKRLTQYDKRVYIASFALTMVENYNQSIDQIYHAMGYKGTPGASDRLKILKSFIKFRAWITLDNSNELKDPRTKKYARFEYAGPLLAYSQVNERDVINGQLVDVAFHISKDPGIVAYPMIEFARQRDQISTFPAKMFATPMRKTEANLALEDYLLERIAHARTGYQPKKIRLSTLYDNTGIKTSQQRHRAPEKIETLLSYYRDIGEIDGFKWGKDSVTLKFAPPKPETAPEAVPKKL